MIDNPFIYRWFFDWSDYFSNPIKYALRTINNWCSNLCHIFRWLKWCWQRAFRGWADCDWWSMDYYLVQTILPMLKALKENTISYPGSCPTPERWDELLDEMIEGFEAAKRVCEDEYYIEVSGDSIEAINNATSDEVKQWGKMSVADQKLFKKKMKIFMEYFFNLWD